MALSATALLTAATSGAVTAWLSASPPLDLLDSTRLLEIAGRLRDATVAWIALGWARHPVLMVGVAAALTLPVLAILGLALHRGAARDDRRTSQITPSIEPRRAWLEGAAGERVQVPTARDLVQIGRLADNDICIDDASVHRYHAVIERMPGCGFMIVDVSGVSGNGVRVNGERIGRHVLVPGDVVELGRARLKFDAAA